MLQSPSPLKTLHTRIQLQATLLHSLSRALQSSRRGPSTLYLLQRTFPLLLSQQIQSFCKRTCFVSNPSEPSDPFFVNFFFVESSSCFPVFFFGLCFWFLNFSLTSYFFFLSFFLDREIAVIILVVCRAE